jgi:hypothetical protein
MTFSSHLPENRASFVYLHHETAPVAEPAQLVDELNLMPCR